MRKQRLSILLVAFGVLGLLYTASAGAYTIQVVNSNGVPQAETSVYDANTDEIIGYSDSNGVINFDIGPGSLFADTQLTDTLSVTRTIYAADTPCETAPEGWPGITGWQVPLLGTLTVTLPAVAGAPYQPDISSMESQMVGFINQQRTQMNMTPVKISNVLNASADKYLSVLNGFPSLNTSDPSTSCLASGPGIRAVDAGFPTLQNVFESVLQGDADATSAVAALQAATGANAALSDSNATLIGIANEGGTWVIDTSEITPATPGYDRAGDTGFVGDPTACPTTPAPASTTTGAVKAEKPKLRIQNLSAHRSRLQALLRIKRKARGKVKVIAVRLHDHDKRVQLHSLRHHHHPDRITAHGHLGRGIWIIRAKFVPLNPYWCASSIHQRLRVR